ncbi:hypothetical protein OG772_13875 [Streptomyces sp. NBC_01321]|nr:hypothetical protein OG772_13875 [Streptomyces sp. NBC_01321]WSU22528.1 hypothetical protein OG508_17175 [Streptomyces sp. NBC_01108]
MRLDIEGCSFAGDSDGRRISGTSDRPVLDREYGDPDSPGWYTLSR